MMTYNPYDYSKKSGIYCFVCKVNDKKYVGQSVNLLERYAKHKGGYSGAVKLVRAIAKYGWENFEWEVLELCPPEQLTDREEYWIREFKTTSDEFGYNIHERQEQPKHMQWSEEAKKRVRESGAKRDHFRGRKQTEEAKKAIGEKHRGKYVSEETRKKLSETRKRKIAEGTLKSYKFSPEDTKKGADAKRGKPGIKNYKKTLVTNIQTGETFIYPSVGHAARAIGIHGSVISNLLKTQNLYKKTLKFQIIK